LNISASTKSCARRLFFENSNSSSLEGEAVADLAFASFFLTPWSEFEEPNSFILNLLGDITDVYTN
jgi:hypothetical protein